MNRSESRERVGSRDSSTPLSQDDLGSSSPETSRELTQKNGRLSVLLLGGLPDRMLSLFWGLQEQADFQLVCAASFRDVFDRAGRDRVDALVYCQESNEGEAWDEVAEFRDTFPEVAVVVIHPGDDDSRSEAAFGAGVQEYLPQQECSSRTLARTVRHSVLRLRSAAKRASDFSDRKRAVQTIQWELAVTAALSELNRPQNLAGATLQHVSDTVLKFARSLTGSDLGIAFVLDPTNGSYAPFIQTEEREARGFGQERPSHPLAATFQHGYPGLWGYALGLEEPFFSNKPDQHTAFWETLDLNKEPVKNFLAVPVALEGRRVGTITLANSVRGYTQREQVAVLRLAETYALALQRILMMEELENKNTQFSGLIDQTREGIALVDTQGKVLTWNRALANLSGVPAVRAVGEYCWEVLWAVANPEGKVTLAEIQAGLKRRDPGSGHWEVKITEAGDLKAQVWLVIPSGWR